MSSTKRLSAILFRIAKSEVRKTSSGLCSVEYNKHGCSSLVFQRRTPSHSIQIRQAIIGRRLQPNSTVAQCYSTERKTCTRASDSTRCPLATGGARLGNLDYAACLWRPCLDTTALQEGVVCSATVSSFPIILQLALFRLLRSGCITLGSSIGMRS